MEAEQQKNITVLDQHGVASGSDTEPQDALPQSDDGARIANAVYAVGGVSVADVNELGRDGIAVSAGALDDAYAQPAIDLETPMILAVQHVLSLSGLAFSAGAVRDLPELTSETFDIKSAVSALRHVGFEANAGDMALDQLSPGHCPAIGFLKSGAAVVVQEIDATGFVTLRLYDEEDSFVEGRVQREELEDHLNSCLLYTSDAADE